jgi:hypothetical protein
MANTKISALTAAAALTGAEQFALVQSATTKVDDLNTIKNFVNVQTVASSATVTPTHENDEVVITAQAVGLTLANPSGTALQGQVMIIRIKDNATTRAITYGSEYRAIGVTLPTTTTVSKTQTDTKWDVIGVNEEA